MFKLSPQTLRKYEDFVKLAKPLVKSKLLCVQIRLGGASKNHVSDWQFNKFENIKVVWNFVNETFLNNGTLNEDYKIFVTTDREEVLDEAIRIFGSNKVVFNKGEIKHLERDVKYNSSDCSAIERTILDLVSLQNCEKISVSFSSGFGLFGAWLRKEPLKNLYMYNHPNFTLVQTNDSYYY
jgi:hypothetical protein